MNVNFEMALQYINLGSYEKAEEELRTAISAETEKNNLSAAAEYRCVLGELLANLGKRKKSDAEFLQVVEYCKETNSLPKQLEIAESFLAKPRPGRKSTKSKATP